jgi:phospholipase/carboxylesterase
MATEHPFEGIVVNADDPVAVVVFLHGYAMDGSELAPLAAAMRAPAVLYFPRAPLKAAPTGCCWWPIDHERRSAAVALGPRDLQDEYPPHRPVARSEIARIIRYVRSRHTDLPLLMAGFSQGGMLAMDAILHEDIKVDGLILLSTSRIAIDDWRPRMSRLRGLPTLVSHGTADPDLSIRAGEELRDLLLEAGAEVTWIAFEGGHEIPLTVWRQIKRIIGDPGHRRVATDL